MKKTSRTIVFFGSGPVAADSLRLIAKDFDVEAVITKPKPEHHIGPSPVIDISKEMGIPVFTASNKGELDKLIATRPFKSNVAVLIDFGIIVSQNVIDYFQLGIINSHFSLLPEWRGADPISFAILSGQPKTGVSLMLIDEGMDTGKLITQRVHPIKPDATTPSLTDELIVLSHDLLTKYLPKYIEGTVKPRNQPHPNRATYSRKLTKQDGIIDWDKPADVIEREIRAFIGWPKSKTKLAGKEIIITKAHSVPSDGSPGTFEVVNSNTLIVYCGSGYLCIEKLKPAGKPEMTAQAFLAGNRIL